MIRGDYAAYSPRQQILNPHKKRRTGLYSPYPSWARCGNFAGISRARLCFVVPTATGGPWQVIEFKAYLERSSKPIMPGSRVRVHPFPNSREARSATTSINRLSWAMGCWSHRSTFGANRASQANRSQGRARSSGDPSLPRISGKRCHESPSDLPRQYSSRFLSASRWERF